MTHNRIVVTIGRGHDSHIPSTNVNGRTLCGKVWTDEWPPETRVSCRPCLSIRSKQEISRMSPAELRRVAR